MDYYSECNRIFGTDITKPDIEFHIPFGWHGSAHGMELMKCLWGIDNKLINTLFDAIKDDGVEGDLLEFGVWQGTGLKRIIEQRERVDLDAAVYGFDSFEGLPTPSEWDQPEWPEGKFADTSVDAVAKRINLSQRDNVKLVKGWFNESCRRPEISGAINKVAYVRIDCDHYQSTLDCLGFLESRLSHGSFMTFDDWLPGRSEGECRAFFEWTATGGKHLKFEHVYSIAQGITHMQVLHRGA